MIAIVDYGVGNVRSILNMMRRIGIDAAVTSDPDAVMRADRAILPGVGAFDAALDLLDASALRPALDAFVASGKPILGICLGMQLLGEDSEEGARKGLGWVPAHTKRIEVRDGAPLPHMGWNWVATTGRSRFMPDDNQRFYFLHSYAVSCAPEYEAATTSYGGSEFTCALVHGNVFGVQFHPEKSHKFGMRLLERFAVQK